MSRKQRLTSGANDRPADIVLQVVVVLVSTVGTDGRSKLGPRSLQTRHGFQSQVHRGGPGARASANIRKPTPRPGPS